MFKFDLNSRYLFAIGLPVIIQNLVNYIQLQTDMALLGHYNSLYLAAVGNVTFPFLIFYNFLLGLTTGATVTIAHAIGAKNISEARRFAEVSFFYNSTVAGAFFIILLLFASTIMTAMGTSAEVNQYGTIYMEILSYSMIFFAIEMSVMAILQGMGKTKHIMIAGILKMIINIVLDWLLIYGKFGFTEMGIEGAALATTISNIVAAIYLALVMFISKDILFRIGKGLLKPAWFYARQNISIGFPNGLEYIMWAVAQVVLIRFVNEIDEISSGIYLLVTRLQAFTYFFYLGLARGTMTLVGQKLGAKLPKEAVQVTLLAVKYSFILCIFTALLYLFYPEVILSIFTADENMIQGSIVSLNYSFFNFPYSY